VGSFVDVVDALKVIFRCAVLVIHHGGKDTDTGPRGSIVFTADFDTVHRVSREGSKQSPVICIQNTHQRTVAERDEPWRFLGTHALGPLVFQPMDNAAYYAHKNEIDPFAAQKIVAILQTAPDASFTTHALASELVGHFDDTEDREKAATAAAKRLMQRNDLAMYRSGTGQAAMWSMPKLSQV
jgi:hypothetical protein